MLFAPVVAVHPSQARGHTRTGVRAAKSRAAGSAPTNRKTPNQKAEGSPGHRHPETTSQKGTSLETQAPVRAQHVAARLADINKWKHEIPQPTVGVRSVPTDSSGIRATTAGLPFGLDQVYDSASTDGANGVTTSSGADAVIDWCTAVYEDLSGTRKPTTVSAPSWLHGQLEAGAMNDELQNWWECWVSHHTDNHDCTHSGCDQEDVDALSVAENLLDDWHWLAREINRLRARVANLTGHLEADQGPCPTPGCNGRLLAPYENDGRAKTATCSNNACGTSIEEDSAAETFRIAMRDNRQVRNPTWVTLDQALYIYGREPATIDHDAKPGMISETQLWKWVERGHVARQGRTYNLWDINAYQASKHQTPAKGSQ